MLLGCLPALAQRIYTETRGYYTVKVPGAPEPGATARTYLGNQFPLTPNYVGLVSAVNGHAVALNQPDASQLADPLRPSYLHVMDGQGRGFVTDIVEFHVDGLICAEDPGPWMGPGMQVFSLPVNLTGSPEAIVRTTGDHALKSGPNADSADVLVFEEPSTGQQRGPFYHLQRANVSGWREVGVDDSYAAQQPMDFLSTLILHRRGAPGWVLVEPSLDPPAVPRPPLPPDPDPDELPLTGEFQFSVNALPGVILTIETSTDLVTWTEYATPEISSDGRCTFPLPAGQGRAIYRLGVELSPP